MHWKTVADKLSEEAERLRSPLATSADTRQQSVEVRILSGTLDALSRALRHGLLAGQADPDELLERIVGALERLERKMSAVQDLNNSVVALVAGFASLDTAVQTEITTLNAALSAAPSTDPAVAQAASNISAIVNKMAVDAAALSASIPAATTVPPPAAPPPANQPVAPTATAPALASVPVTDPNATPPASS